MIKQFVTSKIQHQNWLLVIRTIIGIITISYGIGIFDPKHMQGNIDWLTDIRFPFPTLMAYLGKASELLGGISLLTGFLTRIMCIPLIITMFVITFVMGSGQVFGNDQHPFLLLLIYVTFVLAGSGKWSLDHLIFNKVVSAPQSDSV